MRKIQISAIEDDTQVFGLTVAVNEETERVAIDVTVGEVAFKIELPVTHVGNLFELLTELAEQIFTEDELAKLKALQAESQQVYIGAFMRLVTTHMGGIQQILKDAGTDA